MNRSDFISCIVGQGATLNEWRSGDRFDAFDIGEYRLYVFLDGFSISFCEVWVNGFFEFTNALLYA